MTKKIFIPGRDQKERDRFVADDLMIRKMSMEVAALELMCRQKKAMKFLRGGFWNRFLCWFTDRDPIMTYVIKAKKYAHKGNERGSGAGASASGGK